MTVDESRRDQRSGPQISRFAFALFDVLGFSYRVGTESLGSILADYQQLIERAVLRPSAKGGLTAFQTPEGALLTVTVAPHFAYFSDTILLWCPLTPPLVGGFVERCSDLMCEALAMGIPLRGAITLGDAVLDNESNIYIGKPIVEASNLERGQDWIGLTFGNTAMWSPFLAQIHGASVIEYQTPMKGGYEEYAAPIVVDWPRRCRDKYSTDPIRKLDEMRVSHAANKYDNAKRFASYSASKHDWFKHPESIPPEAALRLFRRSETGFG